MGRGQRRLGRRWRDGGPGQGRDAAWQAAPCPPERPVQGPLRDGGPAGGYRYGLWRQARDRPPGTDEAETVGGPGPCWKITIPVHRCKSQAPPVADFGENDVVHREPEGSGEIVPERRRRDAVEARTGLGPDEVERAPGE